MLNREMKRLIDQSAPLEILVVVVMLNAVEEMSEVSKISDRAARVRALDQAIWKLKKPVVDAIKRYDLSVVNDLDSIPSLVVMGPARAWKKLMSENSGLATDPSVELVPNHTTWQIAN